MEEDGIWSGVWFAGPSFGGLSLVREREWPKPTTKNEAVLVYTDADLQYFLIYEFGRKDKRVPASRSTNRDRLAGSL